MSTTRTLATALALAAIAAPAAQAQRADEHTSVAQAPSKTHDEHQSRSSAARHGAYTPGSIPAVSYPPVSNAAAARPLPGPPTWPTDPQPITTASTVKAGDGGNDVDPTTIALGIAGSLLAVTGIAAIHRRRTRRTQRVTVAA